MILRSKNTYAVILYLNLRVTVYQVILRIGLNTVESFLWAWKID